MSMMDVILSLVTKPFSVMSRIILAGVRSVSIAAFAWCHLLRSIVAFHADLTWKALIWIIALLSLPAKISNALQRERTLEMHLQELQTQFESVIWENKELEQQLRRAINERKVIETVFEEIEEEHEKALSRIDQLENELQDLKEEKVQLNEILGKSPWDYKTCDEKIGSNDKIGRVHEGIPIGSNYGVPSWSTGYKGSGVLQDDLMQGGPWGDADKNKSQEQSLFKPPTSYPYATQRLSRDSIVDEILERRRVVALSRSLFSSILSLIVGMIIWEAEDPCMPLVAALFMVVGMSLNSVVQFFSTIKNKPASDAVALLSVNWFILGTLTSPTLPSVARVLAPRFIRLADRFVIWLGFSS